MAMTFPPRVILHPTDYSDCSEEALRLAARLAGDYDAKLVILHVRPAGGGKSGDWCEGLRKGLHQLRPSVADIPTEQCVQEGDAAASIVNAARETGCDLIVMGTHGRSGLGRLALGSVAEQVVRQVTCPVLLAKAPASH
jgi:nucleotide-binding universal stress UspA family protein